MGALHHSTQPLRRLAARRPPSLPLALQLEPKMAATATRGAEAKRMRKEIHISNMVHARTSEMSGKVRETKVLRHPKEEEGVKRWYIYYIYRAACQIRKVFRGKRVESVESFVIAPVSRNAVP